tara:strand:- start:4751 stop:7336 length:2586 start_codon:yes stop_codon:yes gene_type:complete
MPLVLTSVPDLTGGVSQQPVPHRGMNQCESQVNAMPLVVGGLIKRPPLNHVVEIKDGSDSSINITNAFTHFVRRDNDEEFAIIIDGVSGTPLVNDISDGASKTVIQDNLAGDDYYIGDDGGTNDLADASAVLRAFTIGDVTFIVNTAITPAMAATTSPYSRLQASAPHEALLVFNAAAVDAVISVTVTMDDGATGTATVTATGDQDAGPPKVANIAKIMTTGDASIDGMLTFSGDALNTIAGVTCTLSQAQNGVLHIIGDEKFSVKIETSFGDAGVTVIREETTFFSSLPSTAPHLMKVKVEGNPETNVDDYYVVFHGDGLDVANQTAASNDDEGVMASGKWIQAPGPGVTTDYDYKTLPHILVRQPDGTFVYTEANGETPTGVGVDATVDWASFKFTPRQTGDETTNPLPSFIGQPITDITLFKNRLVITSGENVNLSEIGFYFNFFRTTVTQLLDSAPIDVGVGGTEIAQLDRATPFSDRLMLFSQRSQFSLSGESILSPLTVSVTNVTDFDCDTSSAPVAAGATLFFPFKRGSFTGYREYFKGGTTADIQFDALDITEQVPKFIEGTVKRAVSSTHENLLVVQAESATKLYVYKYNNTSRGKTQSAWFTFEFSNMTILNLQFVGTSLYMLVKRESKTFLERMDLQTGLKDTDSTYVTTLDRRFLIADRTSATETTTTYVISNVVLPDLTYNAVTEDGEVLTISSVTNDGTHTTIVVSNVVAAGVSIYVGLPYTMTYEFSKPLLKRGTQDGKIDVISTGRHQLRYMTVEYDETASFTLRVTPQIGGSDGTAIDYPFSGRFLAATALVGNIPQETGSFRIPLFLQSQNAKIEIINSSALPSNIQSAEFEAQYTTRIEQNL